MVVPSLTFQPALGAAPEIWLEEKRKLRAKLRKIRREHYASLSDSTRALLFRRPPRTISDLVPDGAIIGLYHAKPPEAPASAYARFFVEAGHRIALPFFAGRESAMAFHEWADPFAGRDLETGPLGAMQPPRDSAELKPDVLIMPLVGFTDDGQRIGQGGGHYDRWLADNDAALAIGLAWDCQLVDNLPLEPHDRPLTAIVTPTRLFGPFDA